jgi:glutaredoxin 3
MKTAIIWTQPDCVFCKKSKKLLLDNGYIYIEKMIGEGKQYSKKDLLEAVPTAKTVPQIFLGKHYIGGYEELCKIL